MWYIIEWRWKGDTEWKRLISTKIDANSTISKDVIEGAVEYYRKYLGTRREFRLRTHE